MASTHAKGSRAERSGSRWLERNGYRIATANYRTPVGEIDVVAYDEGVLCFVEIKARASGRFGFASATVTPRQQRRIARAAALYLAESEHRGDCRFDVLAMDREGDDWAYELIRGAFDAA